MTREPRDGAARATSCAIALLVTSLAASSARAEPIELAHCPPYEPNPTPPIRPEDWVPQAISPEPGARYSSIRRVPWRNATYCSTGGTGVVVRRGLHEVPGEMGYVFRVQRVLYADLDVDGAEEAVVQTLENGDGFSGVTGSVLVYALRGGELLLRGVVVGESTVDEDLRRILWDRWPARLAIRARTIHLRLPRTPRAERFRLDGGSLVRVEP